ncbi:MAG: NAD(P)-binding protein, partial [bacterium]|nr:NAD(P)-binding protein [bacterium]
EVLGWAPRRSELSIIIEHAWKWQQNARKQVTRVSVEESPKPQESDRRVAVIGAGPAGVTAAYELAKNGVHVDLFEAAPQVGGLAKTIELWDQRVDLGPHRFFSSDARVNRLWLEVAGGDYQMVGRLTRLLYNNRFFYYPLKPGNAFWNLGPTEAARCGLSYLKQKARPIQPDGSFEDWVVTAFGRRLFEVFFQTYSEKLWGISSKELDADFAAQRIKKLSLYEAVKNAFLGSGGRKHKTLVDRFAYPNQGTGVVYERMAQRVDEGGNRVWLSRPVRKVVAIGGTVLGIETENGDFESYSDVVSTMPLTLLVDRLPEAPASVRNHAAHLKFRNTILVYLRVDADNLFPDNWLYVHSPDIRAGRITNFRNWSKDIRGDQKATILSLEYWSNDEDEMWNWEDRELIDLARREMRQTGLTGTAAISAGHVYRIHRCYPVYSRGYREHLGPVEEYLSTIQGLSVIGRYGAFKYNNQDHSILMGILAAKNIIEASASDLWEINTDYEDYQESGIITEAGLVNV